MKRIFALRHSVQNDLSPKGKRWGLEEVLGQEGYDLIKQAIQSHRDLFMDSTSFFTSPIIRSQQTIIACMEELGYQKERIDLLVRISTDLWTLCPEKWHPFTTTTDFWKRDPEFAEKEGKRVIEVLYEIAQTIPDEGQALCVSHGGILDLAAATALTRLGEANAFADLKDLDTCEGFLLSLNKDSIAEMRYIRLPS